MKQIIVIGLTLILNTAFSQGSFFDRGSGHWDSLSTGFKAVELITQNDPAKLYQYFSPEYIPDSAYIKKECAYVAAIFPFKEGSYPACFWINNEKEFWYERTYYKKPKDKTEYLFQIFITLKRVDKKVQIVEIQFRHAKEVIPREKEVKEMDKPVDENNPPPAPPPPFEIFKNK